MIHNCTCGKPAVLYRDKPEDDPKTLCVDWRCWGVEPSNRSRVESGVDPATSETSDMIVEIMATFDRHSQFMSRLFTVRGLNQAAATDWMVHLMSDAVLNMYFTWNKSQDMRAIRNALLPHVVRAMDDAVNNVIDNNARQSEEALKRREKMN